MIQTADRPPDLVDSSGWIEYVTGSRNADAFAEAIERTENLLVPTLSILEVFRWVLRESGEDAALKVTAAMQQGTVVDLDVAIALSAARIGSTHRLPLADSVIYATAQAHGAELWTQDSNFEDLPSVRFIPKRKS